MRKKPPNFVGYIRTKDNRIIQVLHKKGETTSAAIQRVLRKHGGVYIGLKHKNERK